MQCGLSQASERTVGRNAVGRVVRSLLMSLVGCGKYLDFIFMVRKISGGPGWSEKGKNDLTCYRTAPFGCCVEKRF